MYDSTLPLSVSITKIVVAKISSVGLVLYFLPNLDYALQTTTSRGAGSLPSVAILRRMGCWREGLLEGTRSEKKFV